RACVSARALRRHAAACGDLPRTPARSAIDPDGRAVRRTRRDDARANGLRAAEDLGDESQHGAVRHAQHQRGGAVVGHDRRDDAASRTHPGHREGRPAAAARRVGARASALHRALRPRARRNSGFGDDVAGKSRLRPYFGVRAMNGARKAVSGPVVAMTDEPVTDRQRSSKARGPLRSFVAVVAFLLAWQFLVPLLHVPDYVLPLPSVIAQRFAETFMLQLANLAVTAMTTLAGLAIALVVGVLLALLVVYVEGVKSVVMPFLAAFNSIPKIAIAPLFVNSMTGLGEIEPDILDLSRLAGGSSYRVFTMVRLMHATPYITDALKVAFPLALVG